MSLLQDEPQWAPMIREGKTVYSRALLGSELVSDQFSLFQDGTADCCQGSTIRSPLPIKEIQAKLQDAIARLRFVCPLIAAGFERGIHDPQFRSWVYEPISDTAELESWVKDVIVFYPEAMDADAFSAIISEKHLPYRLESGRQLIFRCYFVPSPDSPSKFSIMWHGPHAILDAWPTLRAFSLLIESMSKSSGSQDPLPWGTEWRNLPAGPVTATGGPRPNWDTDGVALINEMFPLLANPVPPLSIIPQRKELQVPGKALRVRVVIDKAKSAQLLQAVKAAGYSMTYLFEAAEMLAIVSRNNLSQQEAETAHVTFPISIISMDKYFVPPHNGKNHLISAMSLVPICVRYLDMISGDTVKAKLLHIMDKIKEQYEAYLKNPHIPHATAALVKMAPPREPQVGTNPYASMITNVGLVERVIPTVYFADDDSTKDPVFEILNLSIGHRLISATPTSHIWSIQSQLTLQVQAVDLWDQSYVQAFAEDIIRNALAILS